MYGILAVAGWVWTVLFFTGLGVIWWRRWRARRPQGFGVV